ncbi:hypothetical protein LLH00_02090 [bacterium]|nr:hypothetical protein [bacterium]
MHKFKLCIILTLLALSLSACERAEKPESRTLVFEVQSTDSLAVSGGYSGDGTVYRLSCPGGAFLPASSWQAEDSTYRPSSLRITIDLLGELIPSLENPNGYQVQTQFELEGGTILVEHTNQAQLVVSPTSDSLYAVRGEGIVSGGSLDGQTISGFFHEESTYRIEIPESGSQQARIKQINCRYELVVDF